MSDLLLGNVSIESGTLGVGDSSLQIPGGLHPDLWLQHIKTGKAAIDGGFPTGSIIVKDGKIVVKGIVV